MDKIISFARRFCLFFVVAAAPVFSHADEGVAVEGTGEAQVKSGDRVNAKKQAVADALKNCIEKVVGISIQNDFSSEQKETMKGKADEFYSSVRDSVVQKSEGFVQNFELLSEKVENEIYKVKVSAKVFESKIRAEVQKLADLLAAAGNPKLMLVIQEVYVQADGKKRVAKESVLAANLEKELLSRGFELRGAKESKDIADDSVEKYDKWLADSGGAAKMAREAGADILIAGRTEITNKGKIEDTGGLAALEGQIRVEINSVIRGINSASGEVLSAKPVQMMSMGVNEERAVFRAFQGRGNNVVKQTFDSLLDDLKSSFKKTAADGQQYVVQLRGVKSFRKEGQRFLELLKNVMGVSTVKQKSFSDGQLVVDVAFKGSVNDLQEKIFSATQNADTLSTLDVEGVSGKMLTFKL